MDFAEHANLAHPARDQLGPLGTEVQDQDAVGVNIARLSRAGEG
ncbi:MAG: hypothetical protein ACRER0_07745 [Gammaproteobacteria bacterium]